jgi:hypothetical protein
VEVARHRPRLGRWQPLLHPPGREVVGHPPSLAVLPGIANQAETARKRWLLAAFLRKAYRGAYWGLGTDKEEYVSPPEVPALPGYTGAVLDALRTVGTDLERFRPGEQSVLMNHGWALANAALGTGARDQHVTGHATRPRPLEPGAALATLAESSAFRFFGH